MARNVLNEATQPKGMGSNFAYQQLKRAIVAGELPENSQINERKMIRDYSISRTPLREAITRLAAESLVILRPNRSAIIAPAAPSGIAAYFQARTRVDEMVCFIVATRINNAEIEKMSELLKEVNSVPKPSIEIIGAAFSTIACISKNPYLAVESNRLFDTGVRISHAFSCFEDYRIFSTRGFKQIAHAIINRNVASARKHACDLTETLQHLIEIKQEFI